nr:MAG TPA: hypothetical protein [Caudoviricetes sp.]
MLFLNQDVTWSHSSSHDDGSASIRLNVYLPL